MNEMPSMAADPRWGQQNRDRKAEAILATLDLHLGRKLRSGQWLDVGCGSGGIAAALACHVERVAGVDPEPWRQWAKLRAEYANLAFHEGSYRELETLFGAESCDVVVCNQVYEHVDDPAALLAAICSVLKTDGVCYFAGPNLWWPIEPHVFWPFVHWLPRRFARRLMGALGSRRSQDLDAWLWPYGRLVRTFVRAGFDYKVAIPERIRAAALVQPSTINRVASSCAWLARPFPAIAPSFVFVLRKISDVH